MTEYDVIVVGAGPAGSSAAKAAAERGARTIILERHQSIGVPIRCTGLVHDCSYTKSIMSTIPERIILQRHKCRRFYSPSGKLLAEDYWYGKDECLVERDEFDRELARQALEAGATIVVNTNVEGLLKENGRIKGVVTNSKTVPQVLGKIVIGAGGVRSRRMGITKQEGMNIPDETFWSGVYFELAGVADPQPEAYETHFWNGINRNFTNLWPRGGNRYSLVLDKVEVFEQIKQSNYPLARRLRNAYPLRIYGYVQGKLGGHPLPKGMVQDGLMLAGEAGGYMSLVHAVISGRWAGEVADEAIKEGNVSAERLSAYENMCRVKLPYVSISAVIFKGGFSTMWELAALTSDDEIEQWAAKLARKKELKNGEQFDF